MSGWAKLGEALAGTSPARRADIEAKTMNALATRDANVARAKMAMMKARDQAGLGTAFANIGMDNPEDMAVVGRSGVNYSGLTSGMGNMQKQAYREAAVEAATKGDWAAGNANMLGVANGPVEIPKVTGGMLLGNRLVPGGGDVSVTPVGQAQIGADNARGQAALIRANREPASRAGGGGGSGKLSAVQTLRMKSELADIKARKNVALGVLEANAGAVNPAAQANVAKAEASLKALQLEEASLFDRYEGGGAVPSLGERLTPLEPDDGIPEVESAEPMSGPGYYVAADGTQVRVPQERSARVQQVGGKPVVAVTNPAEAKAAWAKLAKGAGLKLPNGTIRWKE